MMYLRALLPCAVIALLLSACDSKPPTADQAATRAPASSNIVGLASVVDFATLSRERAFMRIILTGTHKDTGVSTDLASTLQTKLNPPNLHFALPSPSTIDPSLNYGLSIELVTGNSHPGFSAWYPLDLEHYNGELLSTRLFPLNSSTLVNYQINAWQCGTMALETAQDSTSLWLNANGAGYFLNAAEHGFANRYASFNPATKTLQLGSTRYNCEPNNSAGSMAKRRFAGAKFYAISRVNGWAITVYNRYLELVSRRGMQTELSALPRDNQLNGWWQLSSADGSITLARTDTDCGAAMHSINVSLNAQQYSACGQKLR